MNFKFRCDKCLKNIEDEQILIINGELFGYNCYCRRCDPKSKEYREKQKKRLIKRLTTNDYPFNSKDFFAVMGISKEDMRKARDLAVRRRNHCRAMNKHSKFDTSDPIRTEMTGILGEMKLRQLFDSNNIKYQNDYDKLKDGHDGGFDFKIKNKTIELKTREFNQELLLTTECYSTSRHNISPDFNIYSFINYNKGTISFVGYIDRENFDEFSELKPTMFYNANVLEISHLMPFNNFIEKCMKWD